MVTTATPFVNGWDIVSTLGEGAFAEVKLLMNQESRELVACKIVDITSTKALDEAKKEVVHFIY